MTKEAEHAVKLNRTDLARLVLQEVRELSEHELGNATAAVAGRRQEFWDHVVEVAEDSYRAQLDQVRPLVDTVVGRCTYQCTPDEDGGDVAKVIFSDSQRAYEGTFMLQVQFKLTPRMEELRDLWQAALLVQQVAERRDRRAAAMQDAARKQIIEQVIRESDDGAELVAVAKRCAARVVVDLDKLESEA